MKVPTEKRGFEKRRGIMERMIRHSKDECGTLDIDIEI